MCKVSESVADESGAVVRAAVGGVKLRRRSTDSACALDLAVTHPACSLPQPQGALLQSRQRDRATAERSSSAALWKQVGEVECVTASADHELSIKMLLFGSVGPHEAEGTSAR